VVILAAPPTGLKNVGAALGYTALAVIWVRTQGDLESTAEALGFELLPRRWGAERTFARLTHNRRMSKAFEMLCSTGEAFVYASMTRLMERRLARG
jgi:transposase